MIIIITILLMLFTDFPADTPMERAATLLLAVVLEMLWMATFIITMEILWYWLIQIS